MSKRTLNAIRRKIHKHFSLHGLKEDHAEPLDHILTVSAVIADPCYCAPDLKGNLHQHFFVNIKEILEGDKNLVDNNTVFVAVHYGDEEGLKEPLPGIEPGKPIIIRGKFVRAADAYKTVDNPGYPVLHFTHHPIGYIEYDGVRYE